MVKISVNSRSGRKLGDFDVPLSLTVQEFKQKFASSFPKYYPDRQRFTVSTTTTTPLVDDRKLGDYDLKDGSVLVFKDLGPQISWTTVFMIEYGGPLFLYPMFYYFPLLFYREAIQHHHFVQTLALYCWAGHYFKRELETIFVHRFSHGTMPVFNLFKNSSYYWGCTALVSYFVNHPKFTPPNETNVWLGLAIFVLSELGNFISHVQLRNLRPEGTTTRAIPRGFFFEFVSCPNYFFEVLAWVGFTIMTHTFTAGVFALLGFGQMYVWAVAKHRRYKKEFDGKEGRPLYPRGRTSIIPFLL